MNRTRSVRVLAIAMAGAGLLASCSSNNASSGSPAAASSASGAAAGAGAGVTLGLVQGQDFIHAMPARVAEAQGFFKKQGLDVKIVAFTAGSDLTKAMAGGTVNVGAATGLDVVAGAANGVDLKAFYGPLSKSPMALITGAKSPVTSFDTLKGHKVGISKFGSLTDYYVKMIEKKKNLQAADITEVPLGAPSANIAALGHGDVDAILLPVNFAIALEAQGTGKLAAKVSEITTDEQFAVLMASTKFLTDSASTAKKLASAYAEAIAFMKANKDSTVALAVTALGMKPDIAGKTYDALIGDFTPDGTMNTAGLKAYADALPGLKLATAAPQESSYLSSAFTPVK